MVKLSDDAWRSKIDDALALRSSEPEYTALDILEVYETDSRPLKVATEGGDYVLKACFTHPRDHQPFHVMRRSMATEIISGRIGRFLGAPVPAVATIHLPKELLDWNKKWLARMGAPDYQAGTCYGSAFIADLTPRTKWLWVHAEYAGNKERFCQLAVMYGLLGTCDLQFFYGKNDRLVYSVDHAWSLTFCHGPSNDTCVGWTIDTLNSSTESGLCDHVVCQANLQPGEIQAALVCLDQVTDEAIASSVAAPPDEWFVTMEERVALAKYIARRRAGLLALRGSGDSNA